MDTTTKKQITKRTSQEKLDLIEKWEKSGLSIASFCRQHGFSDSLFYSWLKIYRRKNDLQPESEFIPLQVAASPSVPPDPPSLYAELVLGNAASIKFYQPVTATYLR